MQLRPEDAGQYVVKAVNRLGEAVSTSDLRVFGNMSQFICCSCYLFLIIFI